MKKTIAMMMTGLMILSLAACGSKETSQEPAAETAAENSTEETVGMANPWRDATEEECNQIAANGFSAPEGATNVKWSIMDTGVQGKELVQMTFELDGLAFTARQQSTGDEAEDISGMYRDWTVEDEVTLSNWADGNMKGVAKRFVGEDEFVDVCTWYDVETGTSYSLSTQAKDLEGFDIQAVAGAIYDPAKQFGANAPEESGEILEHERYVDIEGCDTFTQIVDKLPKGYGYTNATIGDTNVLLVTEQAFDDLQGHNAAIDVEVFTYTEDGTPQYAGYIEAGGTAYPLTIADGKLYAGGNHFMKVYTMAFGFPCREDYAWEEFDNGGNATYFYRSDIKDISEAGADENGQVKDDSVLTRLYEEGFAGEVLDFDVIK